MKTTHSADGYNIELLGTKWFAIHINVFRKPDPKAEPDLLRADIWHDHKGITVYSIGLKGVYKEFTVERARDFLIEKVKLWKAPWFRVIRPSLYHRIEVVGEECRTLLLTVYC